MDVTNEGDDRNADRAPEEARDVQPPAPPREREARSPDLSRSQLGYLRSVLWLPGE